MKKVKNGYAKAFAAGVLTLLGCNSPQPSQLKVLDGYTLPPDAGVPAFRQDKCTAFAVSSATMLTAAHCASEGNLSGSGYKKRETMCFVDEINEEHCSSTIDLPPDWLTERNYLHDVAVVAFPEGTFANYFRLRAAAARPGEDLVIVGATTASGDGSRRWGHNVVAGFDDHGQVKAIYDQEARHVVSEIGDSGGPMVIGCQAAGVISQGGWIREGGQIVQFSLFTPLAEPTNASFVREAAARQHGTICDDSNQESTLCDHPVATRSDASTDEFPCN